MQHSTLFKKTKILATLGPAADTLEVLTQLAENGLNAARFNCSHGTHADHKARLDKLRQVEANIGKPIATLFDLQGPKIRLGTLSHEPQVVTKGQKVTVVRADEQTDERLPIKLNIFPHLEAGHHILINDGIIRLHVDAMGEGEAFCTVMAGGEIRSNKGINLPDTTLPNVSLTEKDKRDLVFALENDADYVAVSFVQDEHDILNVKRIIAEHGKKTLVVAKIECKAAIKNLDRIIAVSDVLMVARGDMAVEVGQEEVPIMQRKIIKLMREAKKPVIVATQMLESMIHNAEPTRAEVNDVATAVLDQVDAVMLSAETAHGSYPVEAVAMMERIIKRVERYYKEIHPDFESLPKSDYTDQTTAIAAASSMLAHQLDAKLIFALTASGRTVREIASYRPTSPIVAVTDSVAVYKQMALIWGVKTYFVEKITDNTLVYDSIMSYIQDRSFVQAGDRVVIVVGSQPGTEGHTNSLKVEQIV